MNNSGDAAEQIVKLSLEGIEVAAKITGTAAKEIAMFIVAALKSKNSSLKTKGKARMTSMLKSGKALEIFSVKEKDLQNFMQGAKQYGIVYCVLRNRKNTPDGLCDIMVKAEDAPKISRVAERFKFATVDKAQIEQEIMQSKSDKAQETENQPKPEINNPDKLADDLLGKDDGKTTPNEPDKDESKAVPDKQPDKNEGKTVLDKQPETDKPDASKTTPAKEKPANPKKARTEKSLPSAPTSERSSKPAEGTSTRKQSVREELRDIRAAQQAKAEAAISAPELTPDKPKENTKTTHKQPQYRGKNKKSKGRH